MAEPIRVDQPVFLHDGEVAFGAVRAVGDGDLKIYVENAGDFSVALSAVKDVHNDKVILDGSKLDKKLRAAIGQAHASEDDDDHGSVDDE